MTPAKLFGFDQQHAALARQPRAKAGAGDSAPDNHDIETGIGGGGGRSHGLGYGLLSRAV